MMKQLLLVFIGGGLGSALRYWISFLLNNADSKFPYGTFAVNIIGSLLIGLIFGFALKSNSFSTNSVLFLVTGFCGGFTTFSAFAFENQELLKQGDITSFAIYSIASLVLAIAMVFFGMWIIRSV